MSKAKEITANSLSFADMKYWMREEVVKTLKREFAGKKPKLPKFGNTQYWHILTKDNTFLVVGTPIMTGVLLKAMYELEIPCISHLPEMTPEIGNLILNYVKSLPE